MIYKSIHRYARISPFKARRVANTLKKRPYTELMAYLQVMPHAAAKMIKKVAQSSAANALSQDSQLDESHLFVKNIVVNEGPRMKRMWPRARGRADVLLKRMSHITVELEDSLKGKE